MSRLPVPLDLQRDALRRFAQELRALRDQLGGDAPGVDEVSEREGVPRTTIYAALRGERLPRRDVVAALARSWGGDEQEWLRRRREVEALLSSRVATGRPRITDSNVRSSPRLSSEAFAQLVKIGNQKSYAAGSEILLEGQDVTHVSLVETGIVKLLCRTVDGSSVLQGVLGPGDIVGLESIDGQGSMFSAYSVVDLNVTAIDFEAFTDALSGSKKLSLEIAKQISGRLREASRRRLDFSAYDVHLRVLRVLRELSDRFGEIQSDGSVVIRLGLSQGQIGQLVGAGEASVGRAIRLLREKGLLETGMRSMVLRKRALDFDVNVE